MKEACRSHVRERELFFFCKSCRFGLRLKDKISSFLYEGCTGRIMNWLIGLAGSVLIAAAAYVRRALTASGMAAAVVTGTLMFGFGDLPWYGLLLFFFLSSTLLSRYRRSLKKEAESGYEKTGRRDAGQVAANGGLGLLLCTAAYIRPHEGWWAAFLGVMAAVTADTWATEVGGLSRKRPRSIRTGKPVAPGTSGGITALGLAAAAAGAVSIGLAAAAFGQLSWGTSDPAWIPAAAAGGLCGALADSWIGATWQRMNRCASCGKEVESRFHCGEPAKPLRGLAWMNNDAVNLISSAAGGIVSALVWAALSFSLQGGT